MAWIAPPPTSMELMLWLLVHHDDCSSRLTPCYDGEGIQTSGTIARKKDPHMTMRAMTSLIPRPRERWAHRGSAVGRGLESAGGVAGAVRTSNLRSAGAAPVKCVDRRLGGGLDRVVDSLKAFLRSMTIRAIALTTKVRTKRTRPAAMSRRSCRRVELGGVVGDSATRRSRRR